MRWIMWLQNWGKGLSWNDDLLNLMNLLLQYFWGLTYLSVADHSSVLSSLICCWPYSSKSPLYFFGKQQLTMDDVDDLPMYNWAQALCWWWFFTNLRVPLKNCFYYYLFSSLIYYSNSSLLFSPLYSTTPTPLHSTTLFLSILLLLLCTLLFFSLCLLTVSIYIFGYFCHQLLLYVC